MRISRFSATLSVPLLTIALACAGTAKAAPNSVLQARDDFDARGMMSPGPGQTRGGSTSFSVAQPGRFSMQQSYSLSAMSGPDGSMSSGLYLNTLSYQLSAPLTFSVDVGFHTPIHSSVPGLKQEGGPGSLVLPRMGLEYRPSDRLTMNLELYNGPDAWKAYGGAGGAPWSPRFFQGSRNP